MVARELCLGVGSLRHGLQQRRAFGNEEIRPGAVVRYPWNVGSSAAFAALDEWRG